MNMKAFGSIGEHAGRGPLSWPEFYTPEHAFIPPGQFSEQSTVPLHMDDAHEHFDTRNPDRREGTAVRRHDLTCFQPPTRKPFGQRRSSIVARAQCGHRRWL